MHIGRNHPRNDYKIGDVLLEKISEEHHLGVNLSDDLKPSLQCDEAAKKASSALGIIKRIFQHLKYPVLSCYIRYMFAATWNIVFKLGTHIIERILTFCRKFKDALQRWYLN